MSSTEISNKISYTTLFQKLGVKDRRDIRYYDLEFFASIFSWLPVIQRLFVVFFVLIIAVFLPASAQLSRLIYRVTSVSLLRVFLTSVYAVVPRFVKTIGSYVAINIRHPYPPLFKGYYYDRFSHEFTQETAYLVYPISEEFKEITSEITYANRNGTFRLADPLFSHFFLFFGLAVILLFIYSISHGRSVWPLGEVEFPILVLLLSATSLALLHVERLIDLVRLLEIATLGTYVLVGYERINRFSALAAVQYLIIGTLPSAALILAVALIYQGWGGFTFHELDLLTSTANAVPQIPLENYVEPSYDDKFNVREFDRASMNTLETLAQTHCRENFYGSLNEPVFIFKDLSGFEFTLSPELQLNAYEYVPMLASVLVIFNLLFKLTAAPFHFWAPSVYGNAPVASVAFVSILSKVFVLALRAKLLWTFFHAVQLVLVPILMLAAVLSVFGGTRGAIIERQVKRFYVYSSIGHVGFRLAGISFLYLSGLSAQFHYLAIYILTSYARWFFLIILGPSATHLVHLSRLKDYPELGIFLTFLLFSRSGLPPLAGFYVKLDIFIVLIEGSRFYTAYRLYFLSVVSFFYYLRLIKIFFFDGNEITADQNWNLSKPKSLLWLLSLLTLGILLYGIFVERSLLLIQIEALSALL